MPAGDQGDIEVLCGMANAPTPTGTATPTPTATETPRPSPTNEPSPTREPTATATASPTPTSTTTVPTHPVPAPAYLPLALRESCEAEHQRADVALVIDTSTSMEGRKLGDAKAAALTFIDLMELAPARDQVAIVRFDAAAELSQALTSDRALVAAAIQSLGCRTGSHIDEGLELAHEELTGPRRIAANLQVVVLLTDGIHNGRPGADLIAAQEARSAGIRLYSVGLGPDVDRPALVEIAGDPSRYYHAPDSSDLARIYSEIARDIACPADRFWGRR